MTTNKNLITILSSYVRPTRLGGTCFYVSAETLSLESPCFCTVVCEFQRNFVKYHERRQMLQNFVTLLECLIFFRLNFFTNLEIFPESAITHASLRHFLITFVEICCALANTSAKNRLIFADGSVLRSMESPYASQHRSCTRVALVWSSSLMRLPWYTKTRPPMSRG